MAQVSKSNSGLAPANASCPHCIRLPANRRQGNDLLPSYGYVSDPDRGEVKTLNIVWYLNKPNGAITPAAFWFVQHNLANARSLLIAKDPTPILG